jgi:integrase/recombinase XerC
MKDVTIGRRNYYAILRLLWDNALRHEEVVTLDLSDYLPKEEPLMVLGKGRVDKKSFSLLYRSRSVPKER